MGNIQVVREVGDEPVASDALSQLEAAVLGTMLLDGKVSADLAPSDFGDRRHRPIFQAARAIAADGETPDAVNVEKWLSGNRRLSEAGGEQYLVEVIEAAVLGDVPNGVQTIRRESIRRRGIARLKAGENPARVGAWIMETSGRVQQTEPPPIRTLADILADPDALKPPPVVVPRLAWRERVTMLAAREKDGKTTLATAGAAAVSTGGDFLNESCPQGVVLVVALDEHLHDTVQKLVRFKADPGRTLLVNDLGADRIAGLANAVQACAPDLTVVDSLAMLTAGVIDDPKDSSAWTPSMVALTTIARQTRTGLLLLHHSRKSDGRYRDSSAIGAAVDMILEAAPGPDAMSREIRARGRWPLDDYTVRLNGDLTDPTTPLWYSFDTGELPLSTRILLYIQAHPGCSGKDVRRNVAGRDQDVRAEIQHLKDRGGIENRGPETAWELYVVGESGTGGNRSGNRFERLEGGESGSGVNPYGT